LECFNKQFKAWNKTKQGFASFSSANNLIFMFVFFFNFVPLSVVKPVGGAGRITNAENLSTIAINDSTFFEYLNYLQGE
jgi:hypothetical protein